MEWTYKNRYTFRVVGNFPEPLYSDLQKTIFSNGRASIDPKSLTTAGERNAALVLEERLKSRFSLRLAAYDGDQFIGWSYGWQDGQTSFCMANSAVLPNYRRLGIYQELLAGVLKITKEEGFQVIRSNHLACNNAVIISKLKCGFTISGMELLDSIGLTIKMSYFHVPLRRDAFEYRVGWSSPSDELRSLLNIE